jgi:hypothetical protein
MLALRAVCALNPGNYVVTSAAFENFRVVGTDDQNEGHPLVIFGASFRFLWTATTFKLIALQFGPTDPVNANHVWIVNAAGTLQCELLGVFAATDATGTASGGMTGAGVFTVAELNPQPPLINIGSPLWQFSQGSFGTMYVLFKYFCR